MIQLAQDCLIFRTDSGENLPYSAQMISVEILGQTDSPLDAEFVKHAAAAVLHYFRDELGKESVTVAEFSAALEKILHGLGLESKHEPAVEKGPRIVNSDLLRLADEFGEAGELLFFPRLRTELNTHLRDEPELLCFRGLRACVKRLAGCSRWTQRCQALQDQIVLYLRSCLSQDGQGSQCALVVK